MTKNVAIFCINVIFFKVYVPAKVEVIPELVSQVLNVQIKVERPMEIVQLALVFAALSRKKI